MSEVIVQGGQEVLGVSRIEGPILFVEGAANVSYDEVVEIRDFAESSAPRSRFGGWRKILGDPDLRRLDGPLD